MAIVVRSRAVRFGLAIVALAAVANTGAGVVLVWRDPARAEDLRVMYEWCRAWLGRGEQLYVAAGQNTDYPPNALVLLAPLGMLPWAWVVPLWTFGALLLTPLLAYLVLRCATRGARSRLILPLLLVLCWASAHTLLQFTVLSMTLAFLSLRIVDTHGDASGVLLGLALFKPHIAGPIWLWTAITGRARVAVVSVAVVCAGWVVYCLRIGASPAATLIGYGRILGEQYGGAEGLTGQTSVRGWTRLVFAGAGASDALWIGMATVLLAVACWLARRDPRRALDAGGMAVPGLFCLWSLLAFYHNGNNLILMLPAFAFLWCLDDRALRPSRWIPIVALQAALMFDVPARLGPWAASHDWLRGAVVHFDRVLVMATSAYVAALWWRLSRANNA